MPVKAQEYPVIVLSNLVLLPHAQIRTQVKRQQSANVLSHCKDKDLILFVAAKDTQGDDPGPDTLYSVGTLGRIIRLHQHDEANYDLLIQGVRRFSIQKFLPKADFLSASGHDLETITDDHQEVEAGRRLICDELRGNASLFRQRLPERLLTTLDDKSTVDLVDMLASHLSMDKDQKQTLLSCPSLDQRLFLLLTYLKNEVNIKRTERSIANRMKSELQRKHVEFLANLKKTAISQESGESNEIDELEQRIAKARMPAEVEKKAKSELRKLEQMSHMSSEAGVTRQYIQELCDMPWSVRSPLQRDLRAAEQILADGLYGLDLIKEKVLETIAVHNRCAARWSKGRKAGSGGAERDLPADILCIKGPPGVGKTMLASLIAKAMGRKFQRIALGGVRDEASVRGHRRTYVGAFPGEIARALKNAKTRNPLILLDEIDKMGREGPHGGAQAALLEVLDPEQNKTFQDHYLDVGLDLSECAFVCTANSLEGMPPALLDRMEIIQLSSYTEDEKVQIAQRHLLAKLNLKNGVRAEDPPVMQISEAGLRNLIQKYAPEPGVRRLQNYLNTLIKKGVKFVLEQETAHKEAMQAATQGSTLEPTAVPEAEKEASDFQQTPYEGRQEVLDRSQPQDLDEALAQDPQDHPPLEHHSSLKQVDQASVTTQDQKGLAQEIVKPLRVTKRNLADLLGKPPHHSNVVRLHDEVGVMAGLAATGLGGQLLFIESVLVPGKGLAQCTGSLGDVMKESVQIAYDFLRSQAEVMGLDLGILQHKNLRIHFPDGATPKDGPSGGVAIVACMTSLLKNIPIKASVAATGEVSLHGTVLPVGGIREKLLAASRAGIKTVLVPKDNEADLLDLPDKIFDELEIFLVSDVRSALASILTMPPLPDQTSPLVRMTKKMVRQNLIHSDADDSESDFQDSGGKESSSRDLGGKEPGGRDLGGKESGGSPEQKAVTPAGKPQEDKKLPNQAKTEENKADKEKNDQKKAIKARPRPKKKK
jgi:ATP-dependent Lon protease